MVLDELKPEATRLGWIGTGVMGASMCAHLIDAGYEVCVANSGFAAGVECEKFRPHCMLLDMHLGDVKGEDILKLVRSNADLQLTKVIAMSGKLTDGQAQHLMHNGFDGYLKKPFHVRQVVETVEDAVAIVY